MSNHKTYPFAVAVVRCKENNLLSKDKMMQMADAPTAEDALRILTDSGYGDMSPVDVHDFEKLLTNQLTDMYKSMTGLTREYDFASGLADGVELQTIRVTSVPKGFTASYKDGSVVVTLNDRGIKAGTYKIKVNLYFEGAAEGTKPVSKKIKVKVME